MLGSVNEAKHNEFKRKFLRVIHKNDVITTLPRDQNIFNRYSQFNNQIYLNCSETDTRPTINEVIDCYDGINNQCVAKDFPFWCLKGVIIYKYTSIISDKWGYVEY